MEGFLNKQGEKGLVVNLWRKRWFQLDPHTQRMYYYKSKAKEELLGYINLGEATDVIATEPKDSFSFTIQTRDRAWQLSASSEVDKQAWMAAIDKVIRRTAASIRPGAVQAIATSGSPGTNRKSSEYLGIFEFEGEDGEAHIPTPDSPEQTIERDTKGFTFDMENSEDADDTEFPAPPAPTPMNNQSSFLCGSLPMNVPRMASTWQSNPTWSYAEMGGAEEDAGFVQPHEMAARTYKEITLQTGLDFNNRPRSHSKRMEAYM